MSEPTHEPKDELRPMLRLALPLMAGHAGTALMGVVDMVMVGHLGKASLGGVGTGNALFFVCSLVAMGCVFGMDAPTAQALGAGDPARARRTLWQGLRVAAYASIPAALIIGLLPLVLVPVGVDAEVAAEARRFVWARLPGLWPFLIFGACRSYLQSVHVTRPIVLAMIQANIVNLIGNAVLIYGDESLGWVGLPGIGLPALGVVGSAIASNIAQVMSMIVLIVAVRAVETPPDAARRRADPAMMRTIFWLGLPIGLQMLAEMGVFTLCNVLAGRISKEAAAGYQLAIGLASFTFMFALGVGAATAVRVGQAVGRDDTPAARRAGFMGLKVILVIMSVPAVLFLLFPDWLARLFTSDPTVVAAAVPLFMIAAVFQLSDGVQAVAAGALRGAGDPHVSLWANVIGHWGIGLPISVALGLWAGWGAPGLWWGLSAGLTAVAIGLTWRFARVSSRPIRRV